VGIQQAIASSEPVDSIPKMKVNYMTSLSGNYYKNTAEQYLLTTNNYINFQKGALGFTQLLTYQYSFLKPSPTASSIKLLNEPVLASKVSYLIGKTEPFVMIGFEHSLIRSIKSRYYAIAGADYKLIKSKSDHLSPIFGLSAENTSYKDDTSYDNYYFVFGAKGSHRHVQSKLKVDYSGYFFKRVVKNRWRYQGSLTVLYQVAKPLLYATVSASLMDENIIGTENFERITTISIGLTYVK
jgi:hypothetical protein